MPSSYTALQRHQQILDKISSACTGMQMQDVSALNDNSNPFDILVFDAFGMFSVGETLIEEAGQASFRLRKHDNHIRGAVFLNGKWVFNEV